MIILLKARLINIAKQNCWEVVLSHILTCGVSTKVFGAQAGGAFEKTRTKPFCSTVEPRSSRVSLFFFFFLQAALVGISSYVSLNILKVRVEWVSKTCQCTETFNCHFEIRYLSWWFSPNAGFPMCSATRAGYLLSAAAVTALCVFLQLPSLTHEWSGINVSLSWLYRFNSRNLWS